MRWRLVSRALSVGLILATSIAVRPDRAASNRNAFAGLPSLVLWAWERPEDLRQLDPHIGVAFLAQTLTLRPGQTFIEPRRQPLRVAPATALIATTRIEARDIAGTQLSDRHLNDAVRAIVATATLPGVSGLQLDFDATRSQRPFYQRLLAALRKQLPPRVPVSITALASWCVDDRWLDRVDVDEIVPAIFRMGPTNEKFRDMGAGGAWSAAECRSAIGISLDESVPLDPVRRRVYVFSPTAWDARSISIASRLRPSR